MAGTSQSRSNRIVYFVRTDSLQREARVSRLFRVLEQRGSQVEVFGIVKSADGFAYSHKEYVCRSDKIRWPILKVFAKLLEIQFAALKAFRAHYRECDVLIIANHEFLPLGLLLRLIGRVPVVVDLHEHYFAWLFGNQKFSQTLFLKAFSGVIFANSMRAVDFLSRRAKDDNVVIIRNFPDIPPGRVIAPSYCPEQVYRLAVVSGDVPGRYGEESFRALDQPEFRDRLELVTFGRRLGVRTTHIPVIEYGPYRHWEILELLKSVDGSLVFYDPSKSANNFLCEPNRFFEAYNSGLRIFCFNHPSLFEFYDDYCAVIDQQHFESDLVRLMRAAINEKDASLRNSSATKRVERRLLIFEDGVTNLKFLLRSSDTQQTCK